MDIRGLRRIPTEGGEGYVCVEPVTFFALNPGEYPSITFERDGEDFIATLEGGEWSIRPTSQMTADGYAVLYTPVVYSYLLSAHAATDRETRKRVATNWGRAVAQCLVAIVLSWGLTVWLFPVITPMLGIAGAHK